MKSNEWEPLSSKQRAAKLGLTAAQFFQNDMSQQAKQLIQYAKKKERSQIKLDDWGRNRFYERNVTKQFWKCAQNIKRVHTNELLVQDFIEQYQIPSYPVIIEGCTKNWDVEKFWTFENFYQKFKDVEFKIGQDDDGCTIRAPLKYYLQYLVHNTDDSPLYMFQSGLGKKKNMLPILEHFKVPPYFQNDLLKYATDKRRPIYRWLLMGPERSGSIIHQDPMNTSAWNTLLQGHKRWVLFPETVPEFIVAGTDFTGEAHMNQAIIYFVSILPKIIQASGRQQLKVIQFIQNPRETVFIPGGWWHAVLNLDDTLAITQNYMSAANFKNVWRSMRIEHSKWGEKFIQNLKIKEPIFYEKILYQNQSNDQEIYKDNNQYQDSSSSSEQDSQSHLNNIQQNK